MTDLIDLLDNPNQWPRTVRRVFLVTAPISFPLYGLVWMATLTGMICVVWPIGKAVDLWQRGKAMWND